MPDKTMRQLRLIDDWCETRGCAAIELGKGESRTVRVFSVQEKDKVVTASSIFDAMREWDRLYYRPENPDAWAETRRDVDAVTELVPGEPAEPAEGSASG